MMILQWIFLFLSLITSYSIQISDGDTVDCIDIRSQPAFDSDLLKNHKLQEWPSEFPKTTDKELKSSWPTWEAHVSEANCPKGTVPVRHNQITISNVSTGSPIHEYAVARTKTPREIYGAEATINVWQPILAAEDEMSISQLWLSSGRYETKDLKTIEVGWQVLPKIYQDDKPRLFIFWTNNTYTTGCYNLRCAAGFIQTSNTIVLGGVISPISTYGGKQFELTISVWKDKKSDNWWLSLGPNNSLVGYWPRELFGNLDHVTEVQWGGEILNRRRFSPHTTTQMGSGHFPEEGFNKSSYIRNLKVVDSNNDLLQVQKIDVLKHNKKFYDIKSMFRNDLGFYLFYGGPGSHSGVASLGLNYFLLYFSFIVFLML